MDKTKKIILYLFFALIMVSAVFIAGISIYNGRFAYNIQGIPYFGVFNYKGENAKFSNDTSASIASIIKYWKYNTDENHEQKLKGMSKALSSNGAQLVVLSSVKAYLDANWGSEFSTKIEKIETEDLKKYINSDTRTPLFMFLAVSVDQPKEVTYHPSFVLTGIDNKNKKVRMHSFWLGNDYEVSFDDFEKMWGRMRPDELHNYLIIQPIEMNDSIPQNSNTAKRNKLMDDCAGMFIDYSIARGALELGKVDIAEQYLKKIKENPKYQQSFPKFFKVRLLTQMSQIKLLAKDNAAALEFAKEAVSLNSGLDKAEGEWEGYELPLNKPEFKGVSMDAILALADVQYALGDRRAAAENYSQIVNNFPYPATRKIDLARAESRLNETR